MKINSAKLLALTGLMTLCMSSAVFAEPGNFIPASGNLLTNGDAETGNITGWTHSYPGYDTLYEAQEEADYFTYTNAKAHNGKYFICSDIFIKCYEDGHKWSLSNYAAWDDAKDDVSTVGLYQDVDLKNIPAGKELILRGYVTTEGYLSAAFFDANGDEINYTIAKDRSVKDDNEWKYQRASLIVPNNAVKVRVYLISIFRRFWDGYGDPYGEYTRGGFDDVSLVVKPASSYVPTKAVASGELLKNGGGESGNLDGWFYEYEDFEVFRPVSKTSFFSRSDVTPHTGSYLLASDFYWANSDNKSDSGDDFYMADLMSFDNEKDDTSTASMYQQVDVSGIAAGTQLTLSGYVSDEASISMTFYGTDGKAISSVSATTPEGEKAVDGWKKNIASTTLPQNTAYLRVFLNATYNRFWNGYGDPYGEYTRSAFDDVSLIAAATTAQPTGSDVTTKTDGKSQTPSVSKDAKSDNPMKLKVTKKTFSRKKLSKKKSFSIGVTGAKGKVKYTLSAKAKKAGIKVSKKGKVTVPKKCKKGTYSITVTAAGNDSFSSAKKTVKIVIKK